MSTADKLPQVPDQDAAAVLEQVIVQGDLSKLTPAQRVKYYQMVCQSLGLNPFTKPFDYITLNGKLTLYAKRDATDQLRRIHGISVTRLERERIDDLYVVTAYGQTKDGRTDSAIGAVSIKGLSGEALANAMMKAESKAKRRLTLSLVGLGWLDETEVDSVPGARLVKVNDQGEIEPDQPPQQDAQQQAAPPQPEVVHPGGAAKQPQPKQERPQEQAQAPATNGNAHRRLPTEDEASLLRAAWRVTGLPQQHQDEVLAKPRTDAGWAKACREAAQRVEPGSFDEILTYARALGYTQDEVLDIAQAHDLFPWDEPTPEKLAAIWADIRAGRRLEQATA
ncbi:MAG: hypothetical protein DIU70_006430 [Bacillota bacterium]|nr:MAG: hypothetical protein DIU70_01525 [Bacillota bacterium]